MASDARANASPLAKTAKTKGKGRRPQTGEEKGRVTAKHAATSTASSSPAEIEARDKALRQALERDMARLAKEQATNETSVEEPVASPQPKQPEVVESVVEDEARMDDSVGVVDAGIGMEDSESEFDDLVLDSSEEEDSNDVAPPEAGGSVVVAERVTIHTVQSDAALANPMVDPGIAAEIMKAIKNSLPPALQEGTNFELATYKGSNDPTGHVLAHINHPLHEVLQFMGHAHSLRGGRKVAGVNQGKWRVNVANSNELGYLPGTKMPFTTILEGMPLTGYAELCKKREAAKRLAFEAKEARRKGKGKGKGNGRGAGKGRGRGGKGWSSGAQLTVPNPAEKRDIIRELLDRTIMKLLTPREGENEAPMEYLVYFLKHNDHRVSQPAAGQEPTHKVCMVFTSAEAQYTCSRLLSDHLGASHVVQAATNARPWLACDNGCCTRLAPSDGPPGCCPKAPIATYLVVSRPPAAGVHAQPIPYSMLERLAEIDGVTADYNSQYWLKTRSPWATIRVATAKAHKAGAKLIKAAVKAVGKGVVMVRTYNQCDYCHHFSIDKSAPAHQSVDCPHWANGDPQRQCIDLSVGYRHRMKGAPKLCVTAGLEGCSDPECRLSHHGCTIDTTEESGESLNWRKLMVMPAPATASKTNGGPGTIAVGALVMYSAKEAKVRPAHAGVDMTSAIPLKDRGQFKVLPSKTALQTAAGDTLIVVGATVGAPDILTAAKSGIVNLALQAALGGVAGDDAVLLLPRSASSMKAILDTMGLASAKEATKAILAFPGLHQMVCVLEGRPNMSQAQTETWGRMALQNTMAYILLAAASQGIAVVVYETAVEIAAQPVTTRVRLVAYGDIERPLLLLYQGRGSQ